MQHTLKPMAASVSLVALAACETTGAGSTAITETVQTSLGTVRGEIVTEGDVSAYIYKGIPYAAPPIGSLRWKAPQPPAAWAGTRDATEWPNRCPQGESSMGAGGPISEDCLYVNVVTTAETADAGQPVMVFFHGGGLTSGTGNSTTYNHPKLPSQGVVTVSVNSRLGPIGYLAHPELTAEGPGSGNFGTMDLTASLEWVKNNISAFGGDPDNVTIFGESGGGYKVISQMSTPAASDLFDKAIVQSGSALVSSDMARAEAGGKSLQASLGASNLAEMRAASWQDVIAATEGAEFRPSIVVDGSVIPAPVREQFETGTHNKVPLIVGANAGESMLQTSVPDMANVHATSGGDTWTYNFTHLPIGWKEEEGCVAFHGLELTYVFGAVPNGLESRTTQFLARGGGCSIGVPEHDEVDFKVADEASKIWASFAENGDPSVPGLVDWPQYSESNDVYLDIGDPMTVKSGIAASYTAPPERD
ncbi:MAG: hypothetical protein CMK09_02690 [Ponticaulis sp.]|nr:hypothetical protein [Ponticaulis sp.]